MRRYCHLNKHNSLTTPSTGEHQALFMAGVAYYSKWVKIGAIMEDSLRYLQFKNSLTLAQAALIIIGESPIDWPEARLAIESPKGFKEIIDEMIDDAKYIEREGMELGEIFTEYTLMTNGSKDMTGRTETDWHSTKVDRSDIIKWARLNNLEVSYFGEDDLTILGAHEDSKRKFFTNPTDKTSASYPPELDLAIQAWQAVTSNLGKGKPKTQIRAWLDANTKLANEAKERISIVANWDKTGGATPTH